MTVGACNIPEKSDVAKLELAGVRPCGQTVVVFLASRVHLVDRVSRTPSGPTAVAAVPKAKEETERINFDCWFVFYKTIEIGCGISHLVFKIRIPIFAART